MGSKILARKLREVRHILSALSMENSAEFSMGTEDARERDDCVDGDDIFDTGVAPENIVTTVTIVTARGRYASGSRFCRNGYGRFGNRCRTHFPTVPYSH